MQSTLNRIHEYALEEIMGDRFNRYSKSIILDRALPDVRDGLKPVQRRILYGMYKEHHTYEKAYVKSARSVGDIMGKFHPHGDSSIYEAMVRMSQWWKQNAAFIDMQGNNGSMDGDSAAAMRYTESRLAKVSNELMKDIDRGTVSWAPNFDDTLKEPTVLPAKFPNLLVNGCSGISAGYATNIPPHNLVEVCEAAIKRIESPNCYLDTILNIVKGPDFPTGGIVEGKSGIIDAFTTGRGKVIIKSKYTIEKEKGFNSIVITEIPFDVNKLMLIKKIEEIKVDKKVAGIIDVRDESDRESSVRIVVEIRKDADQELIVNYLYKNTDMMINYNYNMVAIINRRPMTVGIIKILDAYVAFLKEVIINRTKFDLASHKAEMHIVEGLIKALSIIDEVIETIRKSKNKMDAKDNLVKEYAFSELQAEAIVILQLYRLTNTDITELEQKYRDLKLKIQALESILNDDEKLKYVMKEELKKVKTEYGNPRKSEIKDEVEEIKIDTVNLIPKEDTIVVVTKEGYIKRVNLRSYDKEAETLYKERDYVIGLYKMTTLDNVLLFTDQGNYVQIPVYEIPDLKWKELGKHISNLVTIKSEESIIASYPVYDFEKDIDITIFSKNGMVKSTKLIDFKLIRWSKAASCMKLKEDDRVVNVNCSNETNVMIVTKNGYALAYEKQEIPVVGIKASGVKSVNLKTSDEVVNGFVYNNNLEYLTLFTDKKTAKRVKLNEIDVTSRAKRGLLIIRDVKTNPYKIVKSFIINYKEELFIMSLNDIIKIKLTDISIADRYSTGSNISKNNISDVYENILVTEDEQEQEKVLEKENIDLEEIDKKMMTIDDFIDL